MCHPAVRGTPRAAVARPRWRLLYAGTVPQLAALVAVETVGVPNVMRTVLRCVFALGAFAGMAVWLRCNRAALDLQDWCDCAGDTLAIREITSRRLTPPPPAPYPPRRLPAKPAEERELVHH